MNNTRKADIVICGAGIAGIAAAYFLAKHQSSKSILLIDERPAMSLTSDKSGECYRNWWPHSAMVGLMNRSIDLMDTMSEESNNFFHLNHQGYAYVSSQLQSDQLAHFSTLPVGDIRIHNQPENPYQWHNDGKITGADVFQSSDLIQQCFPHLNTSINSLTHVRRAGWLSAQQLGMYMLEQARSHKVQELRASVSDVEIDSHGIRAVEVQDDAGSQRIETRTFINTAGPFVNNIAAMMNTALPIENVLHQKVVFQDIHNIVPRDAPFTILLDEQCLAWSDEERDILQDEPEDHWLLDKFPGGLHVRPEGGAESNWIKLGWAFNSHAVEPSANPSLPESFPDIVVRGASRMIPQLEQYINQIPTPIMYDGGFYTRTKENMPIIGSLGIHGAYTITALSGFGIMAACAAGELLCQQIMSEHLPGYASEFMLSRYENPAYLKQALSYNSGEL